MRIIILNLTLLLAFTAHADVPGIKLADERYTASLIDSDETVFFVSQTTDLAGRLFVGAREGLYVYEPDGAGFGPRQELYRFPKDSWLYDLEVYGNDQEGSVASPGSKKNDAHSIAGGILPGIDPKLSVAKPAGEWNHMNVISKGGKITVKLNGKLVSEVALSHPNLQKKAKQGYIGFQYRGQPFSLRNIKVGGTPVSLASPTTVPTKKVVIDPFQANASGFPPTEAKFVGVNVLATNRGAPCIDELEVFSSDW